MIKEKVSKSSGRKPGSSVFPLEQTPTFEIGGNRVEGVGDGEDLPPTPDPTPLDPPDEEAALGEKLHVKEGKGG